MAATICGSLQICQLKANGKLSPEEEWSMPRVQMCCVDGGLGRGAGEQPAVLRTFVFRGRVALPGQRHIYCPPLVMVLSRCLKQRPAAMATAAGPD